MKQTITTKKSLAQLQMRVEVLSVCLEHITYNPFPGVEKPVSHFTKGRDEGTSYYFKKLKILSFELFYTRNECIRKLESCGYKEVPAMEEIIPGAFYVSDYKDGFGMEVYRIYLIERDGYAGETPAIFSELELDLRNKLLSAALKYKN